jgi:putative PIN family toxin of toxin-antitoxin system
MKRKNGKPKVFFNASVILAGLASPGGGSAKLLRFVREKHINGAISEIIFDEALRHTDKIGFKRQQLEQLISTFFTPCPAPKKTSVDAYRSIVIDEGDAHVLASSYETKADFLVTLDKKHLLILQNKIKGIHIVSPKELLEQLAK